MVICVIAAVSGMSYSAISSISLPMLFIWKIPVAATIPSSTMTRRTGAISFWLIERFIFPVLPCLG